MPRPVQCPQCQFIFELVDNAPRDAADCPSCGATFLPRTYHAWANRNRVTLSILATIILLGGLVFGVILLLKAIVPERPPFWVGPNPVPAPIKPAPPVNPVPTVQSTDLGQLIRPNLPALPIAQTTWIPLNGVPKLQTAEVTFAPPKREGTWRVSFESAIEQVVPAGGGRFLLVYLPAQNQLAVFDGNVGEVTHTIALDQPATEGTSPHTLIAAGAQDIVVAHAGRLTHYDLATAKKGRSVILSSRAELLELAMGASVVDGPLLICVRGQAGDPSGSRWLVGSAKTLQAWNPTNTNGLGLSRMSLTVGAVAANGQASLLQYDPQLTQPVWLQKRALGGLEDPVHLREPQLSRKVAHEMLVFSGSHIVTYTMGDVVPNGRDFYAGRQPLRLHLRGSRVLNEAPPDFEIEVVAVEDWRTLIMQSDAQGRRLSLTLSENLEVPLGQWPVEADPRPAVGSPIRLEQRAFFLPKNQLLVTLPAGDRQLFVHRLDLDAALANAELPGPIVISQPPLTAPTQCRQVMTYQIRCLPTNAQLKYQIVKAPPGPSSIDDTGLLRWEPVDQAGAIGTFTIRITDAMNRFTDHWFRIIHAMPADSDLSAPDRPAAPGGPAVP